uniref:Uncharacterized protein n=1 Tax=Solanum lycopersicum TaxID=4081 RepID=A0A3Q7GKL1_SOLLC
MTNQEAKLVNKTSSASTTPRQRPQQGLRTVPFHQNTRTSRCISLFCVVVSLPSIEQQREADADRPCSCRCATRRAKEDPVNLSRSSLFPHPE